MSLRGGFRRGLTSKEITGPSRRRPPSRRRLFFDRLEEYTAPNMLVPGSLAIGIEAAAAATTSGAITAAVVDPTGDRVHNAAGAMRRAPRDEPFAPLGLGTRGKGHPSAMRHAREHSGSIHGPRTHGSSTGLDASGSKVGAHDESPRLKGKAPHAPSSGSNPVASRGPQSPAPPVAGTSASVAPSAGMPPSTQFAGAIGYLPSSPVIASAGAGLPPVASGSSGGGPAGSSGVSPATTPPTASPAPPIAGQGSPASGSTTIGADGSGLPPTGGGGVTSLCMGCSGGGAGLLNIAQDSVAPDIASGAVTSMSYTQVGNNANPFKYSAVALQITLGDGSTYPINDPSSGGTSTTSLKVSLDNTGHYSQFMAGDGLSVTGSTTFDGTTFDGTLVTAQVQVFSFSKPQPADTEFAVQLIVTGGLLAQQPVGQLQVGGELSLLIHQPGLKIGTFPQSFSTTSPAPSDLDNVPFGDEPLPPPDMRKPTVIILPPVRPKQNGIDIANRGSNVPYPLVDTFGSPDDTAPAWRSITVPIRTR